MSRKKSDGNLKFAAVFFVFIGALIVLSLFFRGIFFLKESKFDGSSHFTLEVQNEPRTNEVQIISFSPKSSTIRILSLENLDPKSLEIPIDAKIDSTFSFSPQNIRSSLFKMVLDFKDQKEVNVVDIMRLFLFSQTIKDSAISGKNIDDHTDKVNIDSITSTFFIDPAIIEEKLNIEIINSTNVFGLGNRLANYVSNMGGNVILVSTGDDNEMSKIEFVKDSYTVKKLSSILNFKSIGIQRKSLPDVIITIGDDVLKNLKF